MNKSMMLLTMVLSGAATCAMAADDTKMGGHMDMKMDMKAHMKMMDTNGDGMISKDEFMKFHESMFDKMKKNKEGMIDLKDMEMMHRDMEMMHKGKAMDKDGKAK